MSSLQCIASISNFRPGFEDTERRLKHKNAKLANFLVKTFGTRRKLCIRIREIVACIPFLLLQTGVISSTVSFASSATSLMFSCLKSHSCISPFGLGSSCYCSCYISLCNTCI